MEKYYVGSAKAESDAGSTISVGAVAAGDVVVVYSQPTQITEKFRRSLNVYGQRLLAATRRVERVSLFKNLPKYSHVMLGLGWAPRKTSLSENPASLNQ